MGCLQMLYCVRRPHNGAMMSKSVAHNIGSIFTIPHDSRSKLGVENKISPNGREPKRAKLPCVIFNVFLVSRFEPKLMAFDSKVNHFAHQAITFLR